MTSVDDPALSLPTITRPPRAARRDGGLQDLAILASRLCATPMSMITMTGAGGTTVAASVGLSRPHDADVAFTEDVNCLLLVPDAVDDTLFCEVPVAIGEPAVRFLAGLPLVDPAARRIGSLWVMDVRSRTLHPTQEDDLRMLARLGAGLLGSDRNAGSGGADESEHRWQVLVEHSPVAVVVLGPDARFKYANPEALSLFGVREPESMDNRPLTDFVADTDPARAVAPFLALPAGGPPLLNHRWVLRRQNGTHLTVEANATTVTYLGSPAVQAELRDVTAKAAAEDALVDSEHRFHAVFNGSPVAMALSDCQGLWVEVNAAFGQLLGVDPAEMIGFGAQKFAHPDDHRLIADSERGQLESPDGVHRLEIRFVRPDGELRWAWVTVTPTPGPAGQTWTLAIAQDVTARKAAETALRESESELAAIAAVARCVQAGDDPRPVLVSSAVELSGASAVSLIEALDDDHLTVTTAQGAQTVGMSVPLDGGSMTARVWRTGEPVFLSDAVGDPLVNQAYLELHGAISVLWQPVVVDAQVMAVLAVSWSTAISDPTHRAVRAIRVIAAEAGVSLNAKRLRTELERSARTDPLTGLLNRRAWDARMAEMVADLARTGGSMTIGLVDVDHFKAFNDTYGHGAGDQLLRNFAQAAGACLRDGDVLARWGGEEFIVALPHTGPEEAGVVLNRIRDCIPDRCTCSIGHTAWRRPEPVSAAVARADSALYEAKQNGRDRLASR